MINDYIDVFDFNIDVPYYYYIGGMKVYHMKRSDLMELLVRAQINLNDAEYIDIGIESRLGKVLAGDVNNGKLRSSLKLLEQKSLTAENTNLDDLATMRKIKRDIDKFKLYELERKWKNKESD